MKTLVIGTGGREHALALALARDPEVTEVHAAPGNPGTAGVATLHEVDPLDGAAVAALERLVHESGPDPRRLERILGNFLDNAREHAGGADVEVEIDVAEEEHNEDEGDLDQES